MSSNPYFDPNADADLFGDTTTSTGHKHALDGSTCSRCNRVHVQPPEGLSPGDLDQLGQLLDSLPDNLVDAMINTLLDALEDDRPPVPPHAHFMATFFEGLHKTDHDNEAGPLLRAMAEVLDLMTDGQVSARRALYELERQLIVTHHTLKACNNALEEARAQDLSGPQWLLGFTCDFLVDRLGILSARYRKVAADAGIEPDELIIEAGVYSNATDLTRHTMLDLMRHIPELPR